MYNRNKIKIDFIPELLPAEAFEERAKSITYLKNSTFGKISLKSPLLQERGTQQEDKK